MTLLRKRSIYIRPFLSAFVLSWVMGSIIRVQLLFDPENPIYGLFVVHAILTPFEGLLLAVLYWIFVVRFRDKTSSANEIMLLEKEAF